MTLKGRGFLFFIAQRAQTGRGFPFFYCTAQRADTTLKGRGFPFFSLHSTARRHDFEGQGVSFYFHCTAQRADMTLKGRGFLFFHCTAQRANMTFVRKDQLGFTLIYFFDKSSVILFKIDPSCVRK